MQDPDSLVQIGTGVTLSQFFELIAKIPEPVLYIALTAWLLLYVIGWFGGINAHTKVALITVISSTLIAIGALPVPTWILKFILQYFPNSIIPVFLVFSVYLALIIGMAVSLYETWVVTQEEIRSDKG
ncbi:MAG: hypothetical protein H6696_18835 [Deferribacteres bacterium]|nr:hypothetical protein [candidate division KSB1 bacterium]MCB9503985.1 hypothetical protein [Deferribacteres bacterium]